MWHLLYNIIIFNFIQIGRLVFVLYIVLLIPSWEERRFSNYSLPGILNNRWPCLLLVELADRVLADGEAWVHGLFHGLLLIMLDRCFILLVWLYTWAVLFIWEGVTAAFTVIIVIFVDVACKSIKFVVVEEGLISFRGSVLTRFDLVVVAIRAARALLALLPTPLAVLAQQGGVFWAVECKDRLLVPILVLTLRGHRIDKIATWNVKLLLARPEVWLATCGEIVTLRRNILDLSQLLDLPYSILTTDDVDVNIGVRAPAFELLLVHEWNRQFAHLLFAKSIVYRLILNILPFILG